MQNVQLRKYDYLNADQDIAWYAQYGAPSQAAFYPNLRKLRAKVARRLQEKGVNLADFNGYTADFDGSINLPVKNPGRRVFMRGEM